MPKMMLPRLALTALCAFPLIRGSALAGEVMRFKSVSVELPQSDRAFPGGHEAEAVNNNCLACHSAGMVLTQPKRSKAEWTETVNKMIHTYKAPIDETDVPTIVAYLASMKPQP
ncbi:cytochrome c [Methylobacterium sp. V23]|jgi:cytochrome c5|uniref:cytochrome c n=1 Tax=Methylobacterium sp. V23 TaxID=2044878 RepID=UPI0015E17745|nr:cytochrome c [Methylobacterium sp. V23]